MPRKNAQPPILEGVPGSGARWSYENAVRFLLSRVNYEALAGARVPPRTPADLERFQKALGRLGHPERQAPAIHVAGTNGKGSTAAIAESLLAGAGYKTGLYTSPHLVEMRERIRVAGAPIGRSEFAQAARLASEFVGGQPGGGFRTTFELLTAMAFLVFCAREVEASVIEVGLGGRLDSTNVIQPRVAIVTAISIDHAEVLGNNVATIAADKAFILKRGTRAISARQAAPAMAALKNRARKVGIRLETMEDLRISDPRPMPGGEAFSLQTPGGSYPDLVVPLRGVHQVENAALAIRAVELFVGKGLDPIQVRKALRSANWAGRFEILTRRPPLVVDGAHNPAGATSLVATLDRYFPNRPVCIVLGASKGKDVNSLLEILTEKSVAVVTVAADHPRALPADELAVLARRFTRKTVEPARDLKTGLILARRLADGGVVCVAGSLYLVGDTLKLWPALKKSWSGAAPAPPRSRTRRSPGPKVKAR